MVVGVSPPPQSAQRAARRGRGSGVTVDSPAGASTHHPATQGTDVQAPVAPSTKSRSRSADRKTPHRSLAYWIVRGLRRAWMALVILLVVLVGAFAVDRLHGIFGKSELTRPGSGLANDPVPFNPKTVVYEIFGPPGTVATINYLDLDAQPQIARDVTLPWTLELSTTAPAAAANIVAQGDSDTIGCRITVDGVIKDQKTSTGVNAQTFCIVKSG
jgi:hypothetical protein